MYSALLVKLRPSTPWRISPDSGARDGVDSVYHSDNLFSAVTLAMDHLGYLGEWLAATIHSEQPAVRFSSCYPFLESTLLVIPPAHLWPPPPSGRMRWKGARFIPIAILESILCDPEFRLREEEWVVDGHTECLLPAPKSGKTVVPFRASLRRTAAVDRLTGMQADPVSTSCLEFSPGAGLWFVAAFSGLESAATWRGPIQAALRWLADSGFGAGRSRGWGRSADPEFLEGILPDLLIQSPSMPDPEAALPPEGASEQPPPPPETAYWILSLFSPSPADKVDWTRGSYSLVLRNGCVESPRGAGARKKSLRMVAEGAVLFAPTVPAGAAADVAPDGFPHPVYRAGYALSIPIAWRAPA
jgi:CRISPR type III-A-associated RAMP protein Csm4